MGASKKEYIDLLQSNEELTTSEQQLIYDLKMEKHKETNAKIKEIEQKIKDINKYLHHTTNFVLLFTVSSILVYVVCKGAQHMNDALCFFCLFILCFSLPATFSAGYYFFKTCLTLMIKKW